MFLTINQANFKEVTNIWNKGFSDYMIPIHMNEEALEKRLTSLGLSKELSCVYIKENEYAGIILLGQKQFKDQEIMWVGGMAISPKFRRLGLGKELMTYAIQKAKEATVDSLNLEVISTNDKAKSLYSHLGFKTVNELTNGYWEIKTPALKHFDLDDKVAVSSLLSFESPITPWQNQLNFATNIAIIKHNQQTIGHLSFKETDDAFIIQQLAIYQNENLSKLNDFISFLAYSSKKKINFSNLDPASKEMMAITDFPVMPTINQFQMKLSF